MNPRTYTKLAIAVIAIFAVLRFIFAITHNVSGDACWHLASATFIATNNQIPVFEGLGRLQPFWGPPVFHLIASVFYKILNPLGLADFSIKLVSPLFGTLTVVVSFFLFRRFLTEKLTFYAILFLNFTPVFLDYTIFSYVDSTMVFFTTLSMYLMLSKRFFLSSVALGIAFLTKYTAIFIFPMFLYLAYIYLKKHENRNAKLVIAAVIPLLISSVWFLRNFILLGNPFWPYLNGIFKGVNIGMFFNEIDFNALFAIKPYLSSYLEFFGVPNGNLSLISFYKGPFLEVLFSLWAISTLVFIFPFIMGLFQKAENKKYLHTSIIVAFLSYLLMLFIYLVNTGWFGARLLLPIVPFMAMIWVNGLKKIKFSWVYLIVIILIGFGFVLTEGIKLSTAANEWSIYEKDFDWATKNTPADALFLGNGQCLSYNINRLVINHNADIGFKDVDYIWTNNKWRIDFKANHDLLVKIQNSNDLELIYANSNTGTKIYEVK